MGWLNVIGLVVAGLPLVFAAFMLRTGIDGLRATRVGGTTGTVSVAVCEVFRGKGGGWNCYGSFRSADEKILIDRVVLTPRFGHDPRDAAGTAVISARVSSASASMAHRVDDPAWQGQLIVGIFGLFISGYLAWLCWRREPQSRPGSRPRPLRRRRRPPARPR